MNVTLRDLLALPEVKPVPSTVEAEEFRQAFSERMAELNRHFQLMAGQANRADYQPLEAQKMKLYEAFQRTSAMLDAGDPTKGEQSIKRLMTALQTIEAKAAEAAAGATNGREEWFRREEEFDNLMARIGELEDAGHTKAGALRKLADSIRNRVNQRSYDQSVSAFDQLRPKFEQIYEQHQQQSTHDSNELPLGGVFPEILWEQSQASVQESSSMVRELEDAEMQKAPLLRKAMGTIQALADQGKVKEALSGYQRMRPQIDAEYELLLRSRAGGVRFPEEENEGASLAMGATPKRETRAPLHMEQLGQGASTNSDSFVEYPNIAYTETEVRGTSGEPLAADYFPEGLPYTKEQRGPHQDATRTPRADRGPQQPSAPKGGGPSGGSAVLKAGSQGPDVVKLQKLLGLTADGQFGPKTTAAVKAWQKSQGLTADGIVGPRTWAALYGTRPPSPTPPKPPAPYKGSSYPSKSTHGREPLQMEQLGKGEPVNSDSFVDYPDYAYTEKEVRGTSDEPLAADYFPEGLPYTEGASVPHQDVTRTPRADRPAPGAGTDAQRLSAYGAPGMPRRHEPRAMDESGGMPSGERIDMPGVVEGDESNSFSGAVLNEKTPDGEVKVLAGNAETSPRGVAASGVIFQGTDGGTTTTVGKGEFKSGFFQEEDGEQRVGMKVAVVGAKQEFDAQKEFGLPGGLVLKGDFGTGTASAEQSIGEKGLAFGAQANAGEASVTIGSSGTGDRDGTTRFGVSEGVGLAGRVHWDDADKDGIPEYGVGADFEWVSFDIKTEDPLRTAMEFNSTMSGMGGLPSPFIEGNMTQDALKGAEEAGAAVGQAINWAKEQAGQFQEGAEFASDQRDRQNERDAELAQQAAQQAQQAYEDVSNTVSEAAQGVEDFADRLFGDS